MSRTNQKKHADSESERFIQLNYVIKQFEGQKNPTNNQCRCKRQPSVTEVLHILVSIKAEEILNSRQNELRVLEQ